MEEDSTRGILAAEGLRLWGAGDLGGALDKYRAAIAATPAAHFARAHYHQQLGSVLAALGRHDEARAEFVRGVELSLDSGKGNDSVVVGVARYFLGNHCLQRGDLLDALKVVTPSIDGGASSAGPLRTIQALALHRLGRDREARSAANAAVAAATSDRQRERIRDQLVDLLHAANEA